MVGGDEAAVQAVMPLFEAMGGNIVHQGGAGAGQHTKMCNQITISGTMIGVCEGLIYGYKAVWIWKRCCHQISGGAAACWSWITSPRGCYSGTSIRVFRRAFYQRHEHRFGRSAEDESEPTGLGVSASTLHGGTGTGTRQILGTQALMLALEQMSGVEWANLV